MAKGFPESPPEGKNDQQKLPKRCRFCRGRGVGTLPAKASDGLTKRIENPSGKPGRKHVLLLDCDPSVRGSLASVLQSEDYFVVSTGDEQEALSQFTRLPIDIALIDLNGENEGRWEVVKQLDAANPRLPIILLTAQAERMQHPLAGRAQAWFQKPLLDLPLLVSQLAALVGSKKNAQAGEIS